MHVVQKVNLQQKNTKKGKEGKGQGGVRNEIGQKKIKFRVPLHNGKGVGVAELERAAFCDNFSVRPWQ